MVEVDYILEGSSPRRAGKVQWNGAVYTEMIENNSEYLTLVNGDETYRPDEWRDLEAPDAVVENLTDPRADLMRFNGQKHVTKSKDGKTGNLVFNHEYEREVLGRPPQTVAVMDSFMMRERGIIEWSRAVMDPRNSERNAFNKKELVAYDSRKYKFHNVAEKLASNVIRKDRPKSEMVLDYRQSVDPSNSVMDILTDENRRFAEELLADLA